MSFDLTVSMKRKCMPSPTQWQAAITDAGFPVQIHRNFDIDNFTGFLPCEYKGALSGFECFSSQLSEEDAAEMEMPGNDFEVTFVVHAGHNEMQTAHSAASALCVASGGVLFDPQSGKSVDPKNAIEWAREIIKNLPEDKQ